jgi:hypothetical protein
MVVLKREDHLGRPRRVRMADILLVYKKTSRLYMT